MAEKKTTDAVSPDSVIDKKGAPASSSDQNLYIVLAWLFAPITSIIWMKDPNSMVQFHAKQSLSWGIVALIGHAVCFMLMFVIIGSCIWPIWSLLDLVVRIIGIVKGINGEKWELPLIGGLIK